MMRALIILTTFVLAMAPALAIAHHPAEDIVDDDIYAFIDEMVADTPHATLDLDGMGNTVITTTFVSTAEALIQQGLLSHASLLDGEVAMTITFEPEIEEGLIYDLPNGKKDKADKRHSKWSEWGGEVVITIIQDKD